MRPHRSAQETQELAADSFPCASPGPSAIGEDIRGAENSGVAVLSRDGDL